MSLKLSPADEAFRDEVRDFLAAKRRSETEVLVPAGPKIAFSGGDTTGNVYLHTLDLDEARDWICASTAPVTDAQRDAYLPHIDVRADCRRD